MCRVSLLQVGLSADPGLCKENLSEVEQQRHTAIQPTHALQPHAFCLPMHHPPTRLPNWDVTRLASLSDGGRFRSAQRCNSVAINNKTTNNQFVQP